MPTPAELIASYIEVWHKANATSTSVVPSIKYERGWFWFYHGSRPSGNYRRSDLMKMQVNMEARIATENA